MKRRLVLITVSALVLLVGWRVYERVLALQGPSVQRAGRVAVELTPVRIATIHDEGTFTGSLEPISQYMVAPKITGRVERLYVHIGDSIRYNQLIAVLDDDEIRQQAEEAQAQLQVAEASIEEARSSLVIAEREYERAQKLRAENFIAEADLETAQARFEAQQARFRVAEAQVTQRKASLKENEVRLGYTQIRATWENTHNRKQRVIGERFVDEGALVNPTRSIVSILEIDTLIGVIHVVERDYSKIQTGMEAIVTTDAYPGRRFTGRIVRIAPLLKEASREARVEIAIPNSDVALKPGMFIRALILLGTYTDRTIVPAAALANRDDRQGVFLADTVNNVAIFTPVEVGITSSGMAEIINPRLSGLVVTLGQHLLEDGTAIFPRRSEPGDTAQPAPSTSPQKKAQTGE